MRVGRRPRSHEYAHAGAGRGQDEPAGRQACPVWCCGVSWLAAEGVGHDAAAVLAAWDGWLVDVWVSFAGLGPLAQAVGDAPEPLHLGYEVPSEVEPDVRLDTAVGRDEGVCFGKGLAQLIAESVDPLGGGLARASPSPMLRGLG